MRPARRNIPPIPGLYVFPALLPDDVQGEIIGEIAREGVFRGGKRDQVMFFPSHSTSATSTSTYSSSTSTRNLVPASTNLNKSIRSNDIDSQSNPEFLTETLRIVEDLLRNKVEDEVFRLLFDDYHDHDHQKTHHQTQTQRQRQKRQRQSIINLYPSNPPSGITPHVDLPARYADGIVGVCLGSGVAVRFVEVDLYVEGDEEGGLWGDAEEGEVEDEEEEKEVDADERAPPHTESRFPARPATPSNSTNSTNLRKNKKKKRKKEKRPASYEVYLPKGTIYVLSGEVRWSWMHGIEARGEDLVWDDDGSHEDESGSEGYNESEDEGDDGSESEGCSEGNDEPERRKAGRLEETLGPGPSVDNPRKRKRTPTATRRKRKNQRTATRILRDTRVSITYRWLKAPPRQGPNRPREEGDEDEEADEGLGGILLEDPVGEGDDWNVR